MPRWTGKEASELHRLAQRKVAFDAICLRLKKSAPAVRSKARRENIRLNFAIPLPRVSSGGKLLSLGGVALMLYGRGRDAEAVKDEAPPKTAASKITHVTVYPDSALVTREVDVPAGDGIVEVIVTPLPPHTVNSSLYSEGTDGIRVLTTRFRTRQLLEDTREDVRKLQDELRQLEMAREKLDAESGMLQANAAANIVKATAVRSSGYGQSGRGEHGSLHIFK